MSPTIALIGCIAGSAPKTQPGASPASTIGLLCVVMNARSADTCSIPSLRPYTSDMYEASEGPAIHGMVTFCCPCKVLKINLLFLVYTIDDKSEDRRKISLRAKKW